MFMRTMVTTAIALLVTAIFPVWAQETTNTPTVDEIVNQTNHVSYYQGADGRAKVTMRITDSQGRVREKAFTILRKDKEDQTDGEQHFYVYFHEPADERGTVFMVWKHIDKDDDRWLYLPGLDVTKRIAASDTRTSFVGSHFFYEDVSGRSLDKDVHELISTSDNYYVLKNTPKDPAGVEFDSYTMWIHRATYIPVKVAYEKGGTVYRTVEVKGVKTIQGYPTVVKSVISDTNIGGSTEMEYDAVEYDIGLPDDIFTERYLRKAPQEYLNMGSAAAE